VLGNGLAFKSGHLIVSNDGVNLTKLGYP